MKTTLVLAAGVVLAAACSGASAESLTSRSGKTGQVITEARVDPATICAG